eukprot:TRINITY_DN13295_c0_g1_i1.p1 TRINITY_DN13295_c0_g1~~TRINITY_DN13295_c0_g1_i1.p1  ORF type:complete len:363 (-),score=86.76 TRINITY_DN13295_c0_g1_i1:679-1722(-)
MEPEPQSSDDFAAYTMPAKDAENEIVNSSELNNYVNQMLPMLGFSGAVNFNEPNPTQLSEMLACFYDVLQKYQTLKETTEISSEHLRKAQSEVARLQARNNEVQQQLEDSRRETFQAQLRHETSDTQHKKEHDKLQSERDELAKNNLQLQHRHIQFQHELRKKEHEFTRLQERLSSVIADRDRAQKVGIEIVNNLQRQAARSTWQKGSKAEEELLKKALSASDEKHRTLVSENEQMRVQLDQFKQTLQDQENLLQMKLSQPKTPARVPKGIDFSLSEEYERLEERERKLEIAQQKLNDALVKLANDRLLAQQQQQSFQRENDLLRARLAIYDLEGDDAETVDTSVLV